MAIETPVLQWPFRTVNNGTGWGFVEQDTPDDKAQCVAFVFSTEPGELPDAPDGFGLPDPTFTNPEELEAALEEAAHTWEPRAALTFTGEELVAMAADVGIGVS